MVENFGQARQFTLMILAFFFAVWGAAPGPGDLTRRVSSWPRPPLHRPAEALDGHATAADRCSCCCSVSGCTGAWVLTAGCVGWPGPVLTAGVAGEVRGAGWREELHRSGGLRGSYTGGPVQRGPRSCRAGVGPGGAEGAWRCGGPASGPEQAKAAALGR